MNIETGMNAIYLNDLKGLDKNSIGIINSIGSDYVVISYPQNFNSNNKVTSHSAKFTEIKAMPFCESRKLDCVDAIDGLCRDCWLDKNRIDLK